jgi:hypothetical protein
MKKLLKVTSLLFLLVSCNGFFDSNDNQTNSINPITNLSEDEKTVLKVFIKMINDESFVHDNKPSIRLLNVYFIPKRDTQNPKEDFYAFKIQGFNLLNEILIEDYIITFTYYEYLPSNKPSFGILKVTFLEDPYNSDTYLHLQALLNFYPDILKINNAITNSWKLTDF